MADDQVGQKTQSEQKVQANTAKTKAGEAASEVKEKAASAAQRTQRKTAEATKEAKQRASEVAGDAKHQAGQLKDKVKEQAQGAKERVQAEAERGFERGKGRVVAQVHSVAQAFRKTGEQLRNEDQGDLAGYTDRIADSVEQVSGYLDEKGLRGTMSDLEGFARQRPGLFVGGALALGLVAARFLRSSGTRR